MNDVLITINNKEAHISQEAYQIFLDRESDMRNELKLLRQRLELLESLLRRAPDVIDMIGLQDHLIDYSRAFDLRDEIQIELTKSTG